MTLSHRVRLSPEDFVGEALKIVEEARKQDVELRILGALAIYIHSKHDPYSMAIYEKFGRFKGEGLVFTDLDLIGYSKQRKGIMDLFEKRLSYKYDPYVKALFSGKRLVYYHPQGFFHVDIFFDKLEFSHDIYFGDRPEKGVLHLDYPTISLAYLILEKLQIHEINWKDLVDLTVLIHAHELCSSVTSKSNECIDEDVIADVLANDWGFWYDATTNLALLKKIIIGAIPNYLDEKEARLIEARINKLVNAIDKKPKSKEWIKRSKIGTEKPWYRKVEELER